MRQRSQHHQSAQCRKRITHSGEHESNSPVKKHFFFCLSALNSVLLLDEKMSVSPHRDGLGDGVDVIVLVFGPVVHSACEGVQPTVMIQRLW